MGKVRNDRDRVLMGTGGEREGMAGTTRVRKRATEGQPREKLVQQRDKLTEDKNRGARTECSVCVISSTNKDTIAEQVVIRGHVHLHTFSQRSPSLCWPKSTV